MSLKKIFKKEVIKKRIFKSYIKEIKKGEANYILKNQKGYYRLKKGNLHSLNLESPQTFYCIFLYGLIIEEGILCSILQIIHFLTTGNGGVPITKIKARDNIYYLL